FSKTKFNSDSVMTLTEKYKYDKRGNLTEILMNRKEEDSSFKISKTVMKYDAENNLIEKMLFDKDELVIHLEYSFKVIGSTKEFHIKDHLQDISYFDKIITYDKLNREIELKEFGYRGTNMRVK